MTTRTITRTKFHCSQLIRSLVDLGMVEAVDPGNAFAEKLGQWIHFADAITLSAVHNAGMAAGPGRSGAQAAARAVAGAEFERTRALLANSIIKSCAPNSGKAHISLPAPPQELPLDIPAAYVPYRRFYEAHQRDMELSIQPLRFNVREAVAKASPKLRKLAELDATLEKILREHEKRLLATVPVLLKKRFEQLFRAHQQQLGAAGQADHPAVWTQAGGWLARFCNDLQMLLLAELELRLQPAMGLIEACDKENEHNTR